VSLPRFGDLRPRTVWDLLDDAFERYRARFVLLASVAAAAFVPAYLLGTALSAGPYARASQSDSFTGYFTYLIIVLPILAIAGVVQAATTSVVVEDVLAGRTPSAGRAWRRVLPRLLPLLAAAVLVGLICLAAAAVSFGVALLFVRPLLAFVGQSLILERRGIVAALRRSHALARGDYGKTLGMQLALGVITGLLGGSLGLLLQQAFSLLPEAITGSGEAHALREFVIGQAASAVSDLLLAPLSGIALTLLYFDLRVRREGLDLEVLATETGVTLLPDYFGGIGGGAPLPDLTPEPPSPPNAAPLVALLLLGTFLAAPVLAGPPTPAPVRSLTATARGDAGTQAREILAAREFRDAVSAPETTLERWLRTTWERFVDWLNRLQARDNSGSKGASLEGLAQVVRLLLMFLGAVAALVGLYVGFHWLKHRRGAPRRRSVSDPDLLADDIADPLAAAHVCAADGDFRTAVRLAYIAALRALQTRGLLTLEANRTNWEYQSLLGRRSLGHAEQLRPATQLFDRVWYGLRPATAEHFTRVAAIARDFAPEAHE
jgi:hypothetical protein